MKKLILRLRHWLIRKLGGYTEQFLLIQRQIVRTESVRPQKVQAQISVFPHDLDSAIDFKQYCESRVLSLLVQELYQSGFILWEREYDHFSQKVNVRATLRVVNADDLRPKIQCWAG